MVQHFKLAVIAFVALCLAVGLSACGVISAESSDNEVDEVADIIEESLRAFEEIEDYEATIRFHSNDPESSVTMHVYALGRMLMPGADLPELHAEVIESDVNMLPEGTIAMRYLFDDEDGDDKDSDDEDSDDEDSDDEDSDNEEDVVSFFYRPDVDDLSEGVLITSEREPTIGGIQANSLPYMFFNTVRQSRKHLGGRDMKHELIDDNEEVGNFETYKIACYPDAAAYTTWIWIDKETWLPVQMLTEDKGKDEDDEDADDEDTDDEEADDEEADDEDVIEYGWTITELEINSGRALEDVSFTYEIPEDAEEITDEDPEEVISWEEATDKAGFFAPWPDYLPDDLSDVPTYIEVHGDITSTVSMIAQTFVAETDDDTEDAPVVEIYAQRVVTRTSGIPPLLAVIPEGYGTPMTGTTGVRLIPPDDGDAQEAPPEGMPPEGMPPEGMPPMVAQCVLLDDDVEFMDEVPAPMPDTEVESISIHDQDASLVSKGDTVTVWWEEDAMCCCCSNEHVDCACYDCEVGEVGCTHYDCRILYTVRGSGFGKDEVIHIAEDLMP